MTFRGHGVYGYDAQHGTYTRHWFDTSGVPPQEVQRGRFEGEALAFEIETPLGRVRSILAMRGTDEFTFRVECTPDQGKTWNRVMHGAYRRGGTAAAR